MIERPKSRHERRLSLLALLGPLPAVLGLLALLRQTALPSQLAWLFAGVALSPWLWSALSIRRQVARALENIASLLAALRQGDFSVRGHESGGKDALGAALSEINGLADALSRQRTEALEASALLTKVMGEIDVAVFAFDRARRLKLANRAAERLFSSRGRPALGTSAAEIGLTELLEGPTPRTVDLDFGAMEISSISSSSTWSATASTPPSRPEEASTSAGASSCARSRSRSPMKARASPTPSTSLSRSLRQNRAVPASAWC